MRDRVLITDPALHVVDFWGLECHRRPSHKEPEYENTRVPVVDGRAVTLGHARLVERNPMAFGKVQKHGGVATCGHHPSRGRFWVQPMLGEKIITAQTLDAILSEQDESCAVIFVQNRRSAWQGFELLSGIPAT